MIRRIGPQLAFQAKTGAGAVRSAAKTTRGAGKLVGGIDDEAGLRRLDCHCQIINGKRCGVFGRRAFFVSQDEMAVETRAANAARVGEITIRFAGDHFTRRQQRSPR